MSKWKTILTFEDEVVVNTSEEFESRIRPYQVWYLPEHEQVLFLGSDPIIVKDRDYQGISQAYYFDIDGLDHVSAKDRIEHETQQPYDRLFPELPAILISNDWRTDWPTKEKVQNSI